MAWIRQKGGESADPDRPGGTPSGSSARAVVAPRAAGVIANIGPSVTLTGELSGNEDLVVDGVVDGRIVLAEHQLTVGQNGRVTAEVRARRVCVAGQLHGNITATDRVEIAATGVVRGDIRAPRVAIADGAKFKGSIDMERDAAAGARSAAAPRQELPRTARSV